MLALVPGYNAGTVALYCVLGFVLVMAVLAILVVILMLFSKGFGAIERATGKLKNKPKKEKSKKSDKPTETVVAQTESSDEDEEVVAAITAALMAYYDVGATDGEDEVPPPFIIKSIKKN